MKTDIKQSWSRIPHINKTNNLSLQTIQGKKTMTYGMEIQILVLDRHDHVVCLKI